MSTEEGVQVVSAETRLQGEKSGRKALVGSILLLGVVRRNQGRSDPLRKG